MMIEVSLRNFCGTNYLIYNDKISKYMMSIFLTLILQKIDSQSALLYLFNAHIIDMISCI